MDIAELRKLAEAATKGPWKWWTSNSRVRLTGADGKDGGVLHSYAYGNGDHDIAASEQDKQFIAAANPAAMLELLDAIERKDATIAALSVDNARLRNLLARSKMHIMDWWRPDGSLPPARSPDLVEDIDEVLKAGIINPDFPLAT